MKIKSISVLLSMVLLISCGNIDSKEKGKDDMSDDENGAAVAVFAGGCYWCMDASFEKLSGLKDVISGYAEGQLDNSTSTGKVEAIKVMMQ